MVSVETYYKLNLLNYKCKYQSYLSNIVTRSSKDHRALRLLRKSPICTTILIHLKDRRLPNIPNIYFIYIYEIALSNEILTIYMRHIFKYTYNAKYRCWTFEYIYIYMYTKWNILNTSNKMSFFSSFYSPFYYCRTNRKYYSYRV